jgi:hypothetical protein
MDNCAADTGETIPQLDRRQTAHRSSVTNGSKLFSAFDKMDGRRQTARRFRDLIELTQNDLGGPELLSEGQRQLIRRAATFFARRSTGPDAPHGGLRRVDRRRRFGSRTVADHAGSGRDGAAWLYVHGRRYYPLSLMDESI